MSSLFEKVGIDLGIVVLLLIVLVIILMIMTVSMSLRLTRLNQKYKSFMKGREGQSLEKLFSARFKEIDRLTKYNEVNQKDISVLKKVLGKTLNKYGIVKYDAFDDVGGKLSFALAMLDENNTEIVKGESYIMLSDEEIDALRQAVSMDDTLDLLDEGFNA